VLLLYITVLFQECNTAAQSDTCPSWTQYCMVGQLKSSVLSCTQLYCGFPCAHWICGRPDTVVAAKEHMESEGAPLIRARPRGRPCTDGPAQHAHHLAWTPVSTSGCHVRAGASHLWEVDRQSALSLVRHYCTSMCSPLLPGAALAQGVALPQRAAAGEARGV